MSLTAQLGTLTTSITGINIDDEGNVAAGQATALRNAVVAVQGTMTEIEGLKEAEGLSDTVVDAIGILENAWDELGEVRLGNAGGNGTAVSAIENAAIQGVTQEQVDTLREALSNFSADFYRIRK